MLVPFAAVNCVPMGAREEIRSIRKEEGGAYAQQIQNQGKQKGKKKMMRIIHQKSLEDPHQAVAGLSLGDRMYHEESL